MTRNMSNIDRITRVILSVVFAYVYFAGVVNGALAVILVVLGAVFLITAFLGFCPLYAPFKFSTIKNQ